MADQPEPLINVKERKEFIADKERVAKVRALADRLAGDKPFETIEEAGEAAEVVKDLRTARTAAEEHKKEITAPHRATTTAVNTEYKELLSPIEAAEAALKRKGLAFHKAQEARERERQRQEAERRQRETEKQIADAQAAAELAAEEPENPEARQMADDARQDAAAKSAQMEQAPVPARMVPRQVKGSGGAALGYRTEWRWNVTDVPQIPAEFLSVDPAKVKAAIDVEKEAVKQKTKPAFALQIPGINIYPEDIPVSR